MAFTTFDSESAASAVLSVARGVRSRQKCFQPEVPTDYAGTELPFPGRIRDLDLKKIQFALIDDAAVCLKAIDQEQRLLGPEEVLKALSRNANNDLSLGGDDALEEALGVLAERGVDAIDNFLQRPQKALSILQGWDTNQSWLYAAVQQACQKRRDHGNFDACRKSRVSVAMNVTTPLIGLASVLEYSTPGLTQELGLVARRSHIVMPPRAALGRGAVAAPMLKG